MRSRVLYLISFYFFFIFLFYIIRYIIIIFLFSSLINFINLNFLVTRFFARFIIIIVFKASFITKSSFLKEMIDVIINEIFFNINK